MTNAEEVIRANPGGALERATPGPRQKWFRLVTGRTDDHGTRFDPLGGDLSVHRQNPVLLWGHGGGRNSIGDPPDPKYVIGHVVDYEQTRDHLDILAEFDTEEFAEKIWQKIQKNLIRACSVGAKLLAPPETIKDGDREIPYFTRWLLREASIVILGSNSEALALDREAMSNELDREAISNELDNARIYRGAVAHQEYPTVDIPWDADQAKKRFAGWASEDGSGNPDKIDWQKYRQCFAWFDDDNPSLNAGKLPHHDIRGGRVVTVLRGVMAASSVLAGARGGVGIPDADLPDVRKHLAAHMAEFDRDAQWITNPPTRAVVTDPYKAIDFDLAPGVASALRQGLRWQQEGFGGPGLVESTMHDAARLVSNGAWWPEKARSAAAWFARHGAAGHPVEAPADSSRPRTGPRRPTPAGVAWALWGGDAGRAQVIDLKKQMDAADAAQEREYLADLTGLRGNPLALLQRDLIGMIDPYLLEERMVNVGVPGVEKLTTSKVAVDKETKMAKAKLTPENTAAIRGLISHHCDAAEMHARAHDLAPSELTGLKTLHRDMAGKNLRDAEELHGALREAHGAHFEPDGEVRAVPEFLRDEDLKRSFSSVYAGIGRQTLTLRIVCRDEIGEEDPNAVRAKIAAFKDDSEELAQVSEKVARAAVEGTLARSEALINEALNAGIITPARALDMRGHDPKNYVSGAAPTRARWTEEMIRSHLASRAGKAPLAEIRSADLRTADGSPAGTGPLIQPTSRESNRTSRVRMGANPMETVDFSSAATHFAQKLREGDIPGQQTRGGPSAEEIAEVARDMAEGRISIPQRPGSEQVLTRFS